MSTVTVGGLPAEVVFWGDKRLGINIPELSAGSHPVVVTTASGQDENKFRVRALIVLTERGECDESFLGTLAGTCWILSPGQITQRTVRDGTRVNIEIENIRRRWYEVTISSGGLSTSAMLGPEGRGAFFNIHLPSVLVAPGTRITFFANGESPRALGMHALDLLFIGVAGGPLPGDLIDVALELISVDQPLFGFGATVAAHLAQGDVWAVVNDLLRLPDLAASDPSIREALKVLFKLSNKKLADEKLAKTLANLKKFGQGIRLVSIIAKELETLTAPRFDTITLVGQ